MDPGMWSTTLSADEQDLLIKKLGDRGWGRMLLFSKYYTPDWGEGNRQVSPRAQATMMRFLEHVTFRKGADPSVFLSNDGELQVAWSDTSGKAVQLLFGPNSIEVLHEAQLREESLPLSAYDKLAQEFSHV
jgi:hypothetical protein